MDADGGFVWQVRSAAQKQTFFGGASAGRDDGCDFFGRKNRAQTMPFSCLFRAFFVPWWRVGVPWGGLTRDAMRAERALVVADGKESGRPHGRTPRFETAGA